MIDIGPAAISWLLTSCQLSKSLLHFKESILGFMRSSDNLKISIESVSHQPSIDISVNWSFSANVVNTEYGLNLFTFQTELWLCNIIWTNTWMYLWIQIAATSIWEVEKRSMTQMTDAITYLIFIMSVVYLCKIRCRGITWFPSQ